MVRWVHPLRFCKHLLWLPFAFTQCLVFVQDMIMPEEMAIADKTTESKILKYISMIKWASENKKVKKKHKSGCDVTKAEDVVPCSRVWSGYRDDREEDAIYHICC